MSRPVALTPAEIDAYLSQARHWSLADGQLVRTATAPTFLDAIDWVTSIAQAAEQMNHHPDIDIRWRTLTLRLSTHDVGAVTDLDTRLAGAIDAIVGSAP